MTSCFVKKINVIKSNKKPCTVCVCVLVGGKRERGRIVCVQCLSMCAIEFEVCVCVCVSERAVQLK